MHVCTHPCRGTIQAAGTHRAAHNKPNGKKSRNDRPFCYESSDPHEVDTANTTDPPTTSLGGKREEQDPGTNRDQKVAIGRNVWTKITQIYGEHRTLLHTRKFSATHCEQKVIFVFGLTLFAHKCRGKRSPGRREAARSSRSEYGGKTLGDILNDHPLNRSKEVERIATGDRTGALRAQERSDAEGKRWMSAAKKRQKLSILRGKK